MAGYGYAWSQRPVYQAKLIMEVQSANENFMNLKDVDPTSGGNSAESLQTRIHDLRNALRFLDQRIRAGFADAHDATFGEFAVRQFSSTSHHKRRSQKI